MTIARCILFAVIICVSCIKKNKFQHADFDLENSLKYAVLIDDSTSNTPSIYHQSHQGNYVFYNIHTESLDFLEVDKGLTKRIYIDSDGPNAIRKFLGFEILDNRIFIADLGRIVEIDFNGNKKAEFSGLKNQHGVPLSPSFFGANQSYLEDDILHFTAFDFMAMQNDKLEGGIVYSLDLKTSELKQYLNYPSFNLKPVSNDYFFHNNVLVLEGDVIFNYSPKEVFKFSRELGEWQKLNFLSMDHFDVGELEGDKTNSQDSKNHFFQNGLYRTIIWDRFRKKYYRIYSFPDGEKESLKRNTRLLVFDEKLDFNQEVRIPNFLTHIGYHLTAEGLFLIDGNFSKKQEDSIQFVRVYPN